MKPRRPIPRQSSRRKVEQRQYAKQRAAYLIAHPYCQAWIAMHGMDENDVVANSGYQKYCDYGHLVPRSTSIHHRNKRTGSRLLDERWWMAVCDYSHHEIEERKEWARQEGYLLPIQADKDGRWGAVNQALTTPELMASKIRP